MLYTARNSAMMELIDKKPVHACVARLPPNACLAIMRVPGRVLLAIEMCLEIDILHSWLTCNTHKGEANDKVTVDTVEEDEFMSNCWNELEENEKASWKYSK
jgi:hypothetical protein